jgi:hypothetical protein
LSATPMEEALPVLAKKTSGRERNKRRFPPLVPTVEYNRRLRDLVENPAENPVLFETDRRGFSLPQRSKIDQ